MPHTKKRSAAVSAIGCLAALTLLAGCGGEAISAGDAKSVYAPHASQFVSDLQSEAKSGAFKAGEKEPYWTRTRAACFSPTERFMRTIQI